MSRHSLPSRAVCIWTAAIAALIWITRPCYSFDLGRCFSGECDVAWQLNKRFDDGLRSKSEAITEPFKNTYYEVANDLFNAKLKPLIEDVDARVKARIGDVRGLVLDTQKAIDLSIEAAAKAADKELRVVGEIEQKAKSDIDSIIRQIDAEIDKIDCIAKGTLDDIRRLITIDLSLIHTDPCHVDRGYRFGSPGFRDDVPKYRIRQCQLERELQESKSVKDILDNLSRLSELSQLTACILRQTTGNALAQDDARRYGEQFSVWYLTAEKK
jgi:hypothetical protein